MKIVKTCCYCATNYNLLPAVLLTPLRGRPPIETPEFMAKPLANPLTGFRLAFKVWTLHLGVEVHFD